MSGINSYKKGPSIGFFFSESKCFCFFFALRRGGKNVHDELSTRDNIFFSGIIKVLSEFYLIFLNIYIIGD